jgi:acetylornithine deacetylase/succinyl-diaminopimelate desuccinylase-like protein
MKSMTVVEAMILKMMKRNNVKPKGDIIFAATADEEMGGRLGVEWLLKKHPKKIRADYVINEGGGFAIPVKKRKVYTVQTAEKAIVWIKIRAKGIPGHGSIPGAADNAVLRMAKVVELLGNHRSKIKLVPTVKQTLKELSRGGGVQQRLFSKLLASPLLADKILDMMAKKEKALAEAIRAMLRITIAPTIINGGVKENVIPSSCEAVFDCRILPGQTKEMLLNEIKQVLKNSVDLEKLEFEILQENIPTESPFDTPLYQAIEKTLKEFDPNCGITPFMMTGGTDSRFLREMGCVCYGFSPIKPDLPLDEFLRMAHGIDERISIENLVFSLSVLYKLIIDFMT